MASLFKLEIGELDELKRNLSNHLTAEDARKLNKHPKVLEAMAETMRAQPAFHLIHGRFNSLTDKLEAVKCWPGISERFSDTVTNLAPEKVFFCFNHAKISTFNRLNSLNMPKKTKSTL